MTKSSATAELARIGLAPRGLSREQAAAYVGVSARLFDEMVADKRMPGAKRINGRTVWDRHAVDRAFSRIAGDGVDGADEPDDIWARAAL